MTSRACFGIAISLLLVSVGCSDDDSSGDGEGGTSGAGGSAGSAASGGAGGSTGGSGGATGGSGGTSATGGSAGSAVGGSGGVAGSAGSTSSGGSAGSSGSGGGSPTGGVQCGSVICDLSQHQCCAFYNQPYKCVKTAAECLYGVDVLCDGPEDCASGQVCCGQMFVQGQNKSYEEFSCAASCDAADQRVICGSSGSCPSGTCGPSDLLPKYNDCK
jgi:hypothetical protein